MTKKISEVPEVAVGTLSIERLRPALGDRRYSILESRLLSAAGEFRGRTLWHVNSTATGGGVAEMLRPMTAYMRDLGLDARWVVVGGNPAFFELTKRIHNGIHGVNGRYRPEDHETYDEVTAANAAGFLPRVKPGDVVICHDPQTAGLVPILRRAGALVIWRAHIGHDDSRNGSVARTWNFLERYIRAAHAVVFSREAYVPGQFADLPRLVIHPSIDPLSVKNAPIEPGRVKAILIAAGLLEGHLNGIPPLFTRPDGSTAVVERKAIVLREGDGLPPAAPMVLLVSRWDRLKDPTGVIEAFARHVPVPDAQLVLAGPDVSGVTDDPEGAEVFEEVRASWSRLPPAIRSRVHVASLPMEDVDENAAIVNALQRLSRVVVQKSLYEGFGLTVTEAMWKARPIVASAVGGIQDQITSGVHGLLIDEPQDLEGCGRAITGLLVDRVLARRLGRNAKERATSRFLVSRHLLDWLEFIPSMLSRVKAEQAA